MEFIEKFKDQIKRHKDELLYFCFPFLTFCVGLALPSPFYRKVKELITEENISNICQVDTVYSDGRHYIGGILDGKRTGNGILTIGDNTYEGEWKDDLLPYGERRNRSSVYKGKFDDNFDNDGFGIVEYTSEYIEGKRSQGYKDNEIIQTYAGNWKKGLKEGLGKSIKVDGSMDFGEYKDAEYQKTDGQLYRHGDIIYGIDVSHYQKDIDWDHLALYCDKNGNVNNAAYKEKKYLQPVIFAFIKASEGSSIQDNRYSVRMREAKRHGVIRGSYHFFHLDTPVKNQVDNFLDVAQWNAGDLPPVLDVEVENEIKLCGEETAKKRIIEWLELVESRLHVTPIIYTHESFRKKCLNDDKFSKYDFWIARYGARPENEGWVFWQNTQTGIVRGYDGNIDIDIYKGNLKSFNAYIERFQ